jgi:hypothetical protein
VSCLVKSIRLVGVAGRFMLICYTEKGNSRGNTVAQAPANNSREMFVTPAAGVRSHQIKPMCMETKANQFCRSSCPTVSTARSRESCSNLTATTQSCLYRSRRSKACLGKSCTNQYRTGRHPPNWSLQSTCARRRASYLQ